MLQWNTMRSTKPELGDFELDLGRYELRRRGRPVKLEKKPMELLIFLVARREQLVTRRDIVTKLWRSDLFVDAEANLNNLIRKIRTALGDNSEKPRFLETVVGKGYRFVGPVRVIDARFSRSDIREDLTSAAEPRSAALLEDRATMAVLPLCLLGNIPDDKGVCLGFADLGNAERAREYERIGYRVTPRCSLCSSRCPSRIQGTVARCLADVRHTFAGSRLHLEARSRCRSSCGSGK